jgi:putative tricarboxylic transport membrane protein
MLDAALAALSSFADPSLVGMLVAGVLAGLVMGMIPGLGGTGAVAVLLPFVYVLEPQQALALIIGAVAVVHTSDTITAVLVGIPGSASATVTLLDGHALAKQGQAARALSMAFLSSMAGGVLGAIGLTLSIPIARPLVLAFGSPELFMLTVLGVSLTALLSRGNILKGMLAGVFGLLLGQVGAAPAAADYRFTFGSLFLTEGLDLVAVALGVFGLAEIASLIAKRGSVAPQTGLGGGWGLGVRDFLTHWRSVLSGAAVGIWAGVLPGIGATAGTWMAYGQAVATAKDKRRFGKGDPRGIIAPESANNSVEAGDLIPTLLFGIPGGAPAALLLGALLVFGVEPGPRLITEDLDIVYTIVYSFAFASILGAGLCFFLSIPLAKLSFVRFPVIAAGLVVIMFTSAFQESEQYNVLLVMLGLGVVGYLMKVCGFPRAPFLIGFVLAIPLERYYYLTANLYDSDEWIVRPGVLAMLGLLLLPIPLALLRRYRRRTRPPEDLPPLEDDEAGAEVSWAHTWWPIAVAAAFLVLFVGALVLTQDFSENAQLVPRLVAIAGILLSVGTIAQELVARRRAIREGEGVPDREWAQELKWSAYAFVWLVVFLVLVYFGGAVIAAAVFVPLFLWIVASVRLRTVVLYTSGVIAALLVLQAVAGVSLPLGLYTPEALA